MNDKFLDALAHAEYTALGALDNAKYCVIKRYGTFFACPYDYAIEHDYHIVCVTI